MPRAAGPKAKGEKKANTVKVSKTYLCPYCAKERKESEFYSSSDPLIQTGLTVICKDCAEKIARNWNAKAQRYGDCTKVSVQEALQRLDKPWLDRVWDTSYFEYVNQSARGHKSIWQIYMRNIHGPAYIAMRWRDGDLFNAYIESAKQQTTVSSQSDLDQRMQENQEIQDECARNRNDIIKLIGYDPFEKESDDDKPLLYSQLIGYLDLGGDGNEDMMRTSSAITIVRGFLQQAKIDDRLSEAMSSATAGRSTEIKTLLDSKQKLSTTISQLAEQSCLSLKHNKNASKGENTFTGQIKKLKEMNLRDAEVNAFDIGTATGMRQVADISHASIIKQIRLDENDYVDMIAKQREMLKALQDKANENEEIARILLRENNDLKNYLAANDIDISDYESEIDLYA